METKLHTSLATLKVLMLNFFIAIIKKQEPHLMQNLLYVYRPPTKGKHKQGGLLLQDEKQKGELEQKTFSPMGPFVVYLIPMK